MALGFNLRVDGLAALDRKLRPEVLLDPPLREAVDATVTAAAAIVEQRAPRGGSTDPHAGRLAASITHRLDATPTAATTFTGRVAVTARGKGGYNYPRLLEQSSKYGHKGWFRGSLAPVKAVLQRQLALVKQHIEATWTS